MWPLLAQVLFPYSPRADRCREQVEALAGADVERIVCVVPHNTNDKKRLKLLLSHKPRRVLG